jgi:Zn finger protein HypA/HybF involved in hydrogenase expression
MSAEYRSQGFVYKTGLVGLSCNNCLQKRETKMQQLSQLGCNNCKKNQIATTKGAALQQLSSQY